jgi:tRNA dimethylallyltransferase
MTADTRPLAIALMGPTASGKTALALDWAQRFGGEIVSVDSALVYRGLDIGAAKPSDEERASVPHHLIDVREPWQPYSAADFANDARAAVDDIVARGHLPILAGGTGLYFRALLQGLSPMPEADAAMRAQLAAEADDRGWTAMHAELATVDPAAAARIHVNDPQRIVDMDARGSGSSERWRCIGSAADRSATGSARRSPPRSDFRAAC